MFLEKKLWKETIDLIFSFRKHSYNFKAHKYVFVFWQTQWTTMTFASGAGTANEWQVLFNLGSYSNTAVYFDKFAEKQREECYLQMTLLRKKSWIAFLFFFAKYCWTKNQ